MQIIGVCLIFFAALYAVADVYGVTATMNMQTVSEANAMDWAVWLGKAIGATLGSSIAVVFRPGGDPAHKLVCRWVIGTILGVVFAPYVIDVMGWAHTFDYWIASACLCGLGGYLFLQVIYSQVAADFLEHRVKRRFR